MLLSTMYSNFVLVSTDKAVNPSNVMILKIIAEIYSYLSDKSK